MRRPWAGLGLMFLAGLVMFTGRKVAQTLDRHSHNKSRFTALKEVDPDLASLDHEQAFANMLQHMTGTEENDQTMLSDRSDNTVDRRPAVPSSTARIDQRTGLLHVQPIEQHYNFVDEVLREARWTTSHVVAYNGTLVLNDLIKSYFGKSRFKMCTSIDSAIALSDVAAEPRDTLVEVTFGCQDLYRRGFVGTGNFMSLFYEMQLGARTFAQHNVDLYFSCPDAEATKRDLIMPWLMGYFAESRQPLVNQADACRAYNGNAISMAMPEIQYDLRRMAIALVGIPSPDHPAAQWAETYLYKLPSARPHVHRIMQLPSPQRGDPPFFPDIELDDAVLHFRCGDLMDTNHPRFGFISFHDFTKNLWPGVRRIGIVTQPFGKGAQMRSEDRKGAARCPLIVHAFVDYLHEHFPNAVTTIHNDPDETVALTYARMIMANQTVIAVTSFGSFGAMANFGTGFIRKPTHRKNPNNFMLHPHVATLSHELVAFNASFLPCISVRRMWAADPTGQSVIDWFRNDTLHEFGNVDHAR